MYIQLEEELINWFYLESIIWTRLLKIIKIEPLLTYIFQ